MAKENRGRNSFKYQGHLMRLSKPKLSFFFFFCITLCPQLTSLKMTAKQTTNFLMVICLDDISSAHASTKTKRKNQRSSFPHKAQDKINPIYIVKAKMSVFLALLVSFAITSTDYRDSSTLSMTENATVVQNKIVNSNFYSYTICRIELK